MDDPDVGGAEGMLSRGPWIRDEMRRKEGKGKTVEGRVTDLAKR